jgi:hypothetical protein
MKYFYVIILFSFSCFIGKAQNKFIGSYVYLSSYFDTIEASHPVETYSLKINNDSTYTYVFQQDPEVFNPPLKEVYIGTWISSQDTVLLFNKNFTIPKKHSFVVKPNQNFEGIKIVVKNKNNLDVFIESCEATSVDTINHTANTTFLHSFKNNCITISNLHLTYVVIKTTDWGKFFVDLTNLSDHTLLETTINKTVLEEKLDGKKFIYKKGFLEETPVHGYCCFDFALFRKVK